MRRHHDDEIAGEPQKYYFEYIYGAHGVQKIFYQIQFVVLSS